PDRDMPPDETNILSGDWPGDNLAWDWLIVQGVDVAVNAEPAKKVFVLPYGGGSATCAVNIDVSRKDTGYPESVQVKITSEAVGLGTESDVTYLGPGDSDGTVALFSVSKPGSYKVVVQAWPVGVEDCNTSNNTVVIFLNVKEPSPVNSDKNLRHELSGM
ncbi:MAG: hypothetical protein ACPLTR_12210, partial [Thermacetogeniaceae bacterium]